MVWFFYYAGQIEPDNEAPQFFPDGDNYNEWPKDLKKYFADSSSQVCLCLNTLHPSPVFLFIWVTPLDPRFEETSFLVERRPWERERGLIFAHAWAPYR